MSSLKQYALAGLSGLLLASNAYADKTFTATPISSSLTINQVVSPVDKQILKVLQYDTNLELAVLARNTDEQKILYASKSVSPVIVGRSSLMGYNFDINLTNTTTRRAHARYNAAQTLLQAAAKENQPVTFTTDDEGDTIKKISAYDLTIILQ